MFSLRRAVHSVSPHCDVPLPKFQTHKVLKERNTFDNVLQVLLHGFLLPRFHAGVERVTLEAPLKGLQCLGVAPQANESFALSGYKASTHYD